MAKNSGLFSTSARRLGVGLVAIFVVLLGTVSPAAAHETEQPYLYLFVSETKVDGRIELAINDVGAVLGIDVDGDDAQIEQALRTDAEELTSYAADHLSIGINGDSWAIEMGRVDLFREGPGALAFAVIQYEAMVPQGTVPRSIEVTFDPFFDEIDGRDGLLLISGGWQDESYERDAEQLVTYTADRRVQTIDLGGQGSWDKVTSGITLGIDHIKTGPDHILFVLALVLPSVLVFRSRWEPVEGFVSSLWRVLKIATFFTLAHSITFTLAGMGWLPLPPSKLVEAIIAGSIAIAALHNLRPVFPNREWALAFVFGLFHGMGFASLVSGLEVSRGSQLLSLLGRNIGIEVGQVTVILLVFPALYLLRATAVYRPLLSIGSVILAVLALGWMVERILEIDLGTDALVSSFASTPAGYWIAGALTVAAFAVNRTLGPEEAKVERVDQVDQVVDEVV